MGIADQSCAPAPSRAKDKTQAQARRQRACGFLGQSPERSLRQSLNRRKPTRCRLNYKKQKKVVLYYKVILEQKSAPFTLSLIKCNPAKSVAILRQQNLSRTTVGANSVRPCSGFAVNSELQGCGGIILFLYQNVVTVGLFLRRANGVRPYTYIELIPQVE